MRPVAITLPFGVLLAAGGILLYASAGHAGTSPSTSPSGFIKPVHPITSDMAVAAKTEAGKVAPNFKLEDGAGRTQTLQSLTNGKPLFAYFIIDGCPCSTTAEPLFHELYRHYKGLVNFVGIIDSDRATAEEWARTHEMPYPILADPNLEMIHAYGAKHSVYNVLVLENGRIDQMWPGYSQDLLKEINEHLALAANVPVKPFDTLYAPLEPTSGCFFPISLAK